MKIVCDACSAKYSIADEKVAGKVFKIRCKRCSNIIVVRGTAAAEQPQEAAHYDHKETRTYGYGDEGDAPKEDAVWHLVIDQDQVGPMSEAEVRERFARGEIDLDTYTWREGFDDWSPLGTVSPFTDLASGAAPGGAEDAAGGMFGGPAVDDMAPTVQSDPADLFAAAAGNSGSEDAAAELFGKSSGAAADNLFGGNGSSQPSSLTGGSPGGIQMSAEAERKLRGERNENSVLFSLNNLAALASDSPKAAPSSSAPSITPGTPGPRTTAQGEGSGLIDIRSMAQVYLEDGSNKAGGDKAAGAVADLPTFSRSAFATSAPVLMPTTAPASANNKTLYIMLGVIGALVVAATVLVILVIRGGDKEPVTAGNLDVNQTQPKDGTKPTDGAQAGKETGAPEGQAGQKSPASGEGDKKPADGQVAEAPAQPGDTAAKQTTPKSTRPKKSGAAKKSAKKTARDDKPKDEPKPRDSGSSSSSGKCLDEVGCLLADRPPPCCSKYTGGSRKARAKKPKSDPNLPESVSKSDIQSAMSRVRGRVVSCGGRHPGKGKVSLSIKVAPSGSVSSVSVKTAPNNSLGNCVASAVRRAKFPKSQKGRKFSYPFLF